MSNVSIPSTRRARRWCGTFFPSTTESEEEITQFHELLGGKVEERIIKYAIAGRETCPTTGRLHLQCYFEFAKAVRFRTVQAGFSPFQVHLIAANGSPGENRIYCSKGGNSTEFGVFSAKAQGKRTDLESIRKEIEAGVGEKSIAEGHFSAWCLYRRAFREYRNIIRRGTDRATLRVCCLYGEAGVGKTRFARQYGTTLGGVWISSCPELKWFDGYDGEECAVLDDFRGGCPFQHLLRLLDIYALDVPIKGGFVPWNPSHIFITSNLSSDEWYSGLTSESQNALRRRIHRSVNIRSMEEFFGTSDIQWDEQYIIIKNKLELV